MNIYLATSWRNRWYEETLKVLRESDLCRDDSIYDFRTTNSAFSWAEVVPEIDGIHPSNWNTSQYLRALQTDKAQLAFNNDFDALINSDIVVLINPCGISAHIEAAYSHGFGKEVIDYYPHPSLGYSLELMKAMFEYRATTINELLTLIAKIKARQI